VTEWILHESGGADSHGVIGGKGEMDGYQGSEKSDKNHYRKRYYRI
jgi:hypothetical protein